MEPNTSETPHSAAGTLREPDMDKISHSAEATHKEPNTSETLTSTFEPDTSKTPKFAGGIPTEQDIPHILLEILPESHIRSNAGGITGEPDTNETLILLEALTQSQIQLKPLILLEILT